MLKQQRNPRAQPVRTVRNWRCERQPSGGVAALPWPECLRPMPMCPLWPGLCPCSCKLRILTATEEFLPQRAVKGAKRANAVFEKCLEQHLSPNKMDLE